jgi:zinc finger SWIM domain-containing protein 3
VHLKEKSETIKHMQEIINTKFDIQLDYLTTRNAIRKMDIFGEPSKDANNLIDLVRNLKTRNHNVFYDYSTDGDNKLERFFLASPSMIRNLQIFGDIIICDTTFGMNRFSMPLMLILGVNQDFCNVCFGLALTRSEESVHFAWVFKALKTIMKASPRLILTDACPSFNKAIESEFPTSKHILCGWHLSQNLKKHFSFLNTKKGSAVFELNQNLFMFILF